MNGSSTSGDDPALNVMVQGEAVIVLLPGGARVDMSAGEAERSARRLLDAAQIARGHVPLGPPQER